MAGSLGIERVLIAGFDVGGTNVRAVGLRSGGIEPLATRGAATVADGDALVEIVVELTEALADDIGERLADLVYVLDPQVFVLGGGLVDLGEPLRRSVEEKLAARILGARHRPGVPVVAAKLGPLAGAIGAAVLAAELHHPEG